MILRPLLVAMAVALAAGASCARGDSLDVLVEIKLDSPTGVTIRPELFGANISAKVEEDWTEPFTNAGDPDYQVRMRELDWPLIRLMLGGRLLGQIFTAPDAPPRWEMFDRLLKNVKFYNTEKVKPKLMISLSIVPKWLDITTADGRLVYAGLAKQVALRCRGLGIYIDYWEVINEPLGAIRHGTAGKGDYEAICILFNEVSKALKQVDGTFKVGGPVLAWPYYKKMKRFLELCGDTLDFVSYHQYGSSKLDMTTKRHMLEIAPRSAVEARKVRKLVSQYCPGRSVPIMVTEYNMHAGWKPHDPRQATVVGGVFVALYLSYAAEGGVDMATVWEAYGDGTFGVISHPDNVIRPAGRVLSKLARHVPGKMVHAKPSWDIADEDAPADLPPLRVIATVRSGGYTVVLINYDEQTDLTAHVQTDGANRRAPLRCVQYEIGSQCPNGITRQLPAGPQMMDIEVPAMSVIIHNVQLEPAN